MNQIEQLHQQIDHLRRTCASNIYTAVVHSAKMHPDNITGRSRRMKVVYCRIIIAHHFRQVGLSLNDTGRILQRDHATVLYLANRYKHEKAPEFKQLAEAVNNILNND